MFLLLKLGREHSESAFREKSDIVQVEFNAKRLGRSGWMKLFEVSYYE